MSILGNIIGAIKDALTPVETVVDADAANNDFTGSSKMDLVKFDATKNLTKTSS